MNIFSQVKNKVAQYFDVYIKLAKISLIGRTANILSYFMFALICLFITFCIVLFLGLGIVEAFIALGLSKLVSFFITILVYFFLLFIVIRCRKFVTNYFASGFINVLTEVEEKVDEEKQKD